MAKKILQRSVKDKEGRASQGNRQIRRNVMAGSKGLCRLQDKYWQKDT